MKKTIAAALLAVMVAIPALGQEPGAPRQQESGTLVGYYFPAAGGAILPTVEPSPPGLPAPRPQNRSLINNDPLMSLEARIVESIMSSNLSGELKLAALREYLSAVRTINADSLARQSQRGTNWKEVVLGILTLGIAVYGVAK